MEIWKKINLNPNYEVSNYGNVRSLDHYNTNGKAIILYKGRKIKPIIKGSYYTITISKKQLYIHRLVAETFIPNPSNYPQVNHKDENKLNNCVDNLEWCTCHYNINYGARNNKAKMSKSKPILQYDLNGNFIKEWFGIKNASENLLIDKSNIGECCRNKRKTAGGYIWKFKEREEKNICN